MPRVAPFEAHTGRYEAWFDEHEAAYRSELAALRALLSDSGFGLEIGVGTGRFGAPLGMDVGLDPAPNMLAHARERGIDVVSGVAEVLPFPDRTFDTALVVTTICFVDDLARTFTEANRVLASDGRLLVGYIDRESPLGRQYQATKDENPFYRDATFVSTEEVFDALEVAGFTDRTVSQTLFRGLGELDAPEPAEDGYGEGSFVAIRATR